MRLPRFAIDNHQFTVIIVLLLVLTGLVSFITMPRSEDPQVSPPASSIIVVLPGANPADMEELIVDPIEEVLNELEDIKHIRTAAEDGLAAIEIRFQSGTDADDKYADVVQKVNSIHGDLPAEIAHLEIKQWTISDVKILQVAIVSDSASYRDLERQAERLEDAFEKVPGVRDVKIWALPEQEIHVSLDFEKAAAKNIPLDRVVAAIQSNNANIPGGSVDIGARRYNIKTSGSFDSIDELRDVIVSAGDGTVVFLKDIADIRLAHEDETYTARVNGTRAVFITATQKPGANIFTVQRLLEEKLRAFEARLPASMKVEVVFDQSKSVAYRLNRFFMNLLQGLFLVGAIVLLAVGMRASVIVMLAIPISILTGIGLLDLSGFGLEQMSIAGLVIALGLLVDNAIVVTENITRFMKKGYSKKDAAVQGTAQIGWAVISSTATTVLAFVPMIMMQNITGDFVRSMPATVVYTLSASLLISLTLTPFLSSKFIRVNGGARESRFQKAMASFIDTIYGPFLRKALRHPKRVLLVTAVVFLSSLAIFPFIGVTFFPKAEKPQFVINVDLPEGTSHDRTDEAVRYVESVLQARDEIKMVAANIGHGNPRIYYNVIPKNEKSNHAQIFVALNTHDLKTFSNLIAELRAEFKRYAGAKIAVKEFEQGPPLEAPIAIRVFGENLDVLKRIAADVEDMVSSTHGTINVNNPLATTKTDLHVRINRAKAAMYGVPIVAIDKSVRAAIHGLAVSTYRDAEGKEYDIVVRLPVAGKPSVPDFDKIYVSSVSGQQIPLKQLAALEFKSSPMVVNHYNLDRTVTITADVVSGISVDQATREIVSKLKPYPWPEGYRFVIAGELENREESFGGMLQAIIIAMVGIFGVLVLQFRSYVQPMIVFAAIPLAIIGSILALFITGYTFSFTAFVGLTSLVGIVVNNSIILVDYTNQLRESGTGLREALIEAGQTRFLPIILTTATTVAGLLPLTLIGGSMWAPMGWTIIGGLFVSTVLTLIIVPTLYLMFSGSRSGETT